MTSSFKKSEQSPSDHGISLLIINPNTTAAMTEGLRVALTPLTPPSTHLRFYTAPADSGAPHAITDMTTSVASTYTCSQDILAKGLLNEYDGFLVGCFSDHPLTHILRSHTSKPVINILEASISHSLLLSSPSPPSHPARFGILTTGTGSGYPYIADTRNFLGASSSERFAGLLTVGLGPAELDGGGAVGKEKVERRMRDAAVRLRRDMGADVIILGCAGMAGMETLIKRAVEGAGLGTVRVVDGAKAGVHFLASLVRLARAS